MRSLGDTNAPKHRNSLHLESPNPAGNGWATLVTNSHDFIASWHKDLPQAAEARWASLFFSLRMSAHVLISVAASQIFLAASGVSYATHLFRNRPGISFPKIKLPLLLFCLATINSMLWADPAPEGSLCASWFSF